MNLYAVRAIYLFEMARTGRTLMQSIVSPVISTSLYFVVFGAAIGSRITEIEGVSYGAFIVPGLIMLTLLTQSVMNASFGIYFPKFVGTIYELLSAPISYVEIVLGYVGAAATKSIILGLIILATAGLFVPLEIAHPVWMLAFLVLTAVTFSLFGFIIGIWADGFEKLQVIPLLVITPLTFLGGTFYSLSVLPPFWQTITLFNPAGLSDQRLPLELLRHRRRERRAEPRHDAAVPGAVPGGRVVDLQDGLSAEELRGSELLHPRPQLDLQAPGAARLGEHGHVGLGDGVGVEQAVGGAGVAGAAALGVPDAAVDDEMRDVDALPLQLARHRLGEAAQRELAHGEGRRLGIALHAGRGAGEEDRAPALRQPCAAPPPGRRGSRHRP